MGGTHAEQEEAREPEGAEICPEEREAESRESEEVDGAKRTADDRAPKTEDEA
jgi:hypothetical protein